MQNEKKYIYWEKQNNDLMCGKNALNSLLQSPIFNEINLAEIGHKLDLKEKELLGDLANNNVNDSGFFNIQVLMEALKSYGNYELNSIESSKYTNYDFSKEDAFICHNDHHWFSIRKIHNIWFNLNSTNQLGPQIISEFYLDAFINSIKQNGYHIFLVVGNFNDNIKNESEYLQNPDYQFYYELDYLKGIYDNSIKNKTYDLNSYGTDENDLKKAIKLSLQGNNNNNNPKPVKPYIDCNKEQDPELFYVLKDSIVSKFIDEPKDSENIFKLKFKLPDNTNIIRNFEKSILINELYDYIFYEFTKKDSNFNQDFKIIRSIDKSDIPKEFISLEQLDIKTQELFLVIF